MYVENSAELFSNLASLLIGSLYLFVLYFQAYQKTIDRLEKELKQAKAAVSESLSVSWLFHAISINEQNRTHKLLCQ